MADTEPNLSVCFAEAPLLGEPLAKRSSVPKCQSLPSIGEVARRSRDGEVQAQKQRDERDDFYNTLLIIKDTVFLSIEKDTLFSEVMHEMQKTRPWAILAAGAAIQVLTGLPAAWGVFQRPVMEEYGLSEQGAGYAFGVLIAFFGIGQSHPNQYVFVACTADSAGIDRKGSFINSSHQQYLPVLQSFLPMLV